MRKESWKASASAHLHVLGVEGRVEHNPRTAAKLSVRRDVDSHRVLVLDQRIHDHRAVLEDLGEHVARAAREAAPVREDDEREVLRAVEVADRLRRLERRVREPDLRPSSRCLISKEAHMLTTSSEKACSWRYIQTETMRAHKSKLTKTF